MVSLTVRKFNGSSEAYSGDKLRQSIHSAGGSPELAQRAEKTVFPLLAGRSRGGMITSMAIKEDVAAFLYRENPAVARSYQEYRKPIPK